MIGEVPILAGELPTFVGEIHHFMVATSQDAPRSNRSRRSVQCCDSHGGNWHQLAMDQPALMNGSKCNSSSNDVNDDIVVEIIIHAIIRIYSATFPLRNGI